LTDLEIQLLKDSVDRTVEIKTTDGERLLDFEKILSVKPHPDLGSEKLGARS